MSDEVVYKSSPFYFYWLAHWEKVCNENPNITKAMQFKLVIDMFIDAPAYEKLYYENEVQSNRAQRIKAHEISLTTKCCKSSVEIERMTSAIEEI